MGNTGLLRCKAKMTLLHPHLGETRRQELAFLAFLLVPVSTCEGGRGLPPRKKKAPLKTLRVSHPIKISPFVAPTTRKEAPAGNAPIGAIPHKAVTNRFPQEGETELQRLQGSFSTPQ